MTFNDWTERDGTDIEAEAGRQEMDDSKKKSMDPKDTIPAITQAPTMTLSDDGDSYAGSTGGGSKLSAKVKVVRWYNNRGRVQKGIMIGAIVLVFVVLFSVAIWAATQNGGAPTYSNNSASEAIPDRDFDVPIILSTAPPTTSPPSAPSDNEVTDNIMDNQAPTNDMGTDPIHDIPKPNKEPGSKPNTAPKPTDPAPSPPIVEISFVPGLLRTSKEGLLLSEGLDARIIAQANEEVDFDKKKKLGSPNEKYLDFPGAGATFEMPDGGWIYVSNSEAPNKQGGVGALTFDKHGKAKSYDVILKGTSRNRGGGKTPFGTWVSCEEEDDGQHAKTYQVDPTGKRKPEVISISHQKGCFESFTYDVRDEKNPHFFVSGDDKDGALQRFTPNKPDWKDPWKMLHKDGTTDYLMLVPYAANNGGVFLWTDDREEALTNAQLHYPYMEGLDVHGSKMYFTCKQMKQVFVLDLDAGTYYNHTTEVGLFDGAPDEVQRVEAASQELLYFTEKSGSAVHAGVHARDHYGKFYTILESELFGDETTGLSFSPDGRFMYVAYQSSGLLYAIWRTDGHGFHYRPSSIYYNGY